MRSRISSLPQVQQQVFTARRLFFPEAREPLLLPEQEIEIPPPPQAPPPPPPLNWWTTVLPPLLMAMAVLAGALVSTQSLIVMLPMLLMSLGFPIANLLGQKAQQRAYQEELRQREEAYRQTLAKVRSQIESLAQQQREALEDTYPTLRRLLRIAEAADKRMWSRRPTDEDFLALRIGRGEGLPSFSIQLPSHTNSEDPLIADAFALGRAFQKLPALPFLIDLASLGSLAISGKATGVYALSYRLLLDLLVHHSPQDVKVFLLGDTRSVLQRWEWLKWVPHTGALEHPSPSPLAFEAPAAGRIIELVMDEFHRRQAAAQGSYPLVSPLAGTALVLLVDDSGEVRRHPDMRLLAEQGHEVGIYLLFVGGRDWPRECRARLDVLDEVRFRLVETSGRTTKPRSGEYESASLAECERAARALAGWTVTGRGGGVPLPESIRLSNVLGPEAITAEAIQQAWTTPYEPGDLLRFPIGVYAHRDRLDVAMLNLLPAALGGQDAYHTILIGTTGSGKSEFMKSLVLGAAIRYPPTLLNFFFMDFKGGAAFNIFADLPHVTGIVTNLSPELVERGLDSIRNEIDRRQAEFDAADPVGKRIKDIWEYNRLHPEQPMPHLILFLDEFARGLMDFPRLREVLNVLVSQGRSLGMYLILANQDVNAHVDRLLNNVGWRIALRVAKPEEMQIIQRGLPTPARAGQGYLRLSSGSGEIIEFQAGYAGFPVKTGAEGEGNEGFRIYEVKPDGTYREVWRQAPTSASTTEEERLKEEEFILQNIRQAAKTLEVQPAKRIYLDPLPATIPFAEVLEEAGVQPAFRQGQWASEDTPPHVVAHWGKIDMPKLCLQSVLSLDFDAKDGHLWIVGAPQSGLDLALSSLVFSLALRYPPDQVQFYMLELGAGELAPFETLPHTGALIYPQPDDPQEHERLKRLLNLLDRVFQERSKAAKGLRGKKTIPRPALFVVINSFGELRANFPEEAERLTRFVRDGGRLGIHFIITSARGPELPRSISNMIARRLVLQLVSKDDYLDIVGQPVAPLTKNIPGRGYWVDEGVAIAQVTTPPSDMQAQTQAMRAAWHGPTPEPVKILPAEIPLSELLGETAKAPAPPTLLPVGKAYETLATVAVPLEENPTWLILGPRGSGKSNFLACAARCVLEQEEKVRWVVRTYALRRSNPLAALEKRFPQLHVLRFPEEIAQDVQQLTQALQNKEHPAEKPLLILIDDLGFAFQPGREALSQAFNELGRLLEEQEQVVLMASALLDEIRMQLASPLVKRLRQNRTGVVLSQNTSETEWLGASIPLSYRRMDLPLGRGFFIYKGRLQLVQTPLWEK